MWYFEFQEKRGADHKLKPDLVVVVVVVVIVVVVVVVVVVTVVGLV